MLCLCSPAQPCVSCSRDSPRRGTRGAVDSLDNFHIGAGGCQGSNPAATFLHCHQQELSDVALSPSTSCKKADAERGAAPIPRCQGQPCCSADAVPPSTIITPASFPPSWQDSALCSPTKQPSVQFRYGHLSQKRKAMKQPWQLLNAWHHTTSL